MGDEERDKQARIEDARAKLRERYLHKQPHASQPQGSGEPNRHGMPKLPPGQTLTRKWPVLDLGRQSGSWWWMARSNIRSSSPGGTS
jgi:hypothetical protein